MGWSTGLAPRASNSRTSDSVCSEARVMRIFRPASGDAEASTMLAPDFFEDGLRAGFEEEARDVFAERGGLLGRGGGTLADILRTVDRADAGFEDEFAALGAGPGAKRNLAATLQRGEQGAFGDDGGARFGVVESAQDFGGFGVGKTAFGSDSALADGGQKNIGRKGFGDAIAPAEAVEAGFGEENAVVLAALGFAEARVDIAAKVADVEIGANVAKLRLAAKAAGADARTLAQIGQRGAAGGDEAVPDIFAAEDGGKGQARVDFGGNVLDAVDRDIDRFVEQSVFEFLDEDTLAADLGQRGVGEFIAESLDDDDFRFNTGGGKEALADVFGLPFGQQAAARADAQVPHGLSLLERKRSRRASTFWILRRNSFSPRKRSAGWTKSLSRSSSIKDSMRSRSPGAR